MTKADYKKAIEESILSRYENTMKEEQEQGIFRNRYEYGDEQLLKVVSMRRRKLINASDYRLYVSIIEKHFLF